MKHFFPFSCCAALLPASLLLLSSTTAQAQVGIGTTTPNAKAALEVSATDKGLLIPRLTQAQRTAMTSVPDGLMVFQTDNTTGFWYYFGGAWVNIPNASTAGDNLGNHTATQNLNLGANQLVGNGGSAGIGIGSTGNVGIGTTAPAATLHVGGSSSTVRLEGLAGTGSRVVTTDASGNLAASGTVTGESTTASNGLTLSGTDVKLGGTLAGATTIDQANNML